MKKSTFFFVTFWLMYFEWRDAIILILLLCRCDSLTSVVIDFGDEKRLYYKEKVKSMFYHAYNGYLTYAYPLDELRPLTCSGMDTWGSFSLTLIDALDSLVVLGNHTEFIRAVNLVLQNVKVDSNVNVSVFETNIRVVGGLLSAHMLSGRVKGFPLHPGWPCAGQLLDLAERFVQKLLPAFNTETGMPYGTVNLKYGVPQNETPITCTACIGSYIIEFGTLSRLTGNPHYERVALKALKALWDSRSALGLVGNHINVKTGVWTASDAGIGAAVDSYFEYLVKGGLLFQRPLLIHQFNEYENAINKYVRKEDWFVWVTMTKGQVTLPIFQSLEAYWPSILTLLGKVEDASKIMLNYNQVIRQYGLPPEFYNLQNRDAQSGRSGYPLRPEIVESLLYLYQATNDPNYLQIAAGMVEAIEKNAYTRCGYATVRDVINYTLEDRMESFFLAETTKYLYLLFDKENFLHNDGSTARLIQTTDGTCAIEAGGYIFNTEAHPIDPGILYCCGVKRQNDTIMLRRFEENIDFFSLINLKDQGPPEWPLGEEDLDRETAELGSRDKEFSLLTEEEINLVSDNTKILRASTDPFIKPTVEKSCSPLERWKENSPALNHMLSIIYGKQDYKLAQETCLPSHSPVDADSSRYSNTLPSMDKLEVSNQVEDGVNDYSLNDFRYKSLANERFHLLSTNPNSFAANFAGLGQVVPTAAG